MNNGADSAVHVLVHNECDSATFVERLGRGWQRAQGSIAYSARTLGGKELIALCTELEKTAKKPFNVATASNDALRKAKKKLAMVSDEARAKTKMTLRKEGDDDKPNDEPDPE
jgi:hypothetical protein